MRREDRRQARMEKHAVLCPHCGKTVLDHMTECPYCGGELQPAGYQPMNDEKSKRVRRVSMIVSAALTVVLFVVIIVLKTKGIL